MVDLSLMAIDTNPILTQPTPPLQHCQTWSPSFSPPCTIASKSDMQSQLIEHASRYTDALADDNDNNNDDHGNGTWNDATGVPTTSQQRPHPSLVNPSRSSPQSTVRHALEKKTHHVLSSLCLSATLSTPYLNTPMKL